MCALDLEHPGYHWSRTRAMARRDHLAALDALGPTVIIAMSFAPVAQVKLLFDG